MNRSTGVRITITGIVQGVGFRPFLYKFLQQHQLVGMIKNTGNLGVTVDLISPPKNFDLTTFVAELKAQIPPIAFIEDISVEPLDSISASELSSSASLTSPQIIASNDGIGKGLTLPPDIAICDECIEELLSPTSSRFRGYPFIACAHCGPRFTIMHTLPYDRENSTAAPFPFCQSCATEYKDVSNRRFHAQTFHCAECGPQYFLQDPHTIKITAHGLTALNLTVEALRQGKIVAIKGIGGVNLLCRADQYESIATLRSRKKHREQKPFAVMMSSLAVARKYCTISSSLETYLTSFRRPIVLCPINPASSFSLPENLAPGLSHCGIILPYMGLHHLLFQSLGPIPLVFTSGNESHLPMGITNSQILHDLIHLADLFLLHDRDIYQRCDDSVLREVNQQPTLLRRSRGFVPEYFKLPFSSPYRAMVAVGPEINTTGAITRGDRIFPTQHIGTIQNLETFEFLDNALRHMQRLLKVNPGEIGVIAHDLHPSFLSTRLAHQIQKEMPTKSPLCAIQHHHAHLASLLVDHKLPFDTEAVCLTLDGVGYGSDGQPWGGEILVGSYTSFQRKGFLHPFPMIGGDLCAKYPARMLACALLSSEVQPYHSNSINSLFDTIRLTDHLPAGSMELEIIQKNFPFGGSPTSQSNIPWTSSMGRILDAAASLFNVCQSRTYEGEPAQRLEGFIGNTAPQSFLSLDGYLKGDRILTAHLLRDYADLLITQPLFSSQSRVRVIAASFVHDLSTLLGTLACNIATTTGLTHIGVSGGVAYNDGIVRALNEVVTSHRFTFLQHHDVPCGDAGISIGQSAIAAAMAIQNSQMNRQK